MKYLLEIDWIGEDPPPPASIADVLIAEFDEELERLVIERTPLSADAVRDSAKHRAKPGGGGR